MIHADYHIHIILPIIKFTYLLSVNVVLTMYFAACTSGGVGNVAVDHHENVTDTEASEGCDVLNYLDQDGVTQTGYEYAMLENIDENNAASIAMKDLECNGGGKGVMFR